MPLAYIHTEYTFTETCGLVRSFQQLHLNSIQFGRLIVEGLQKQTSRRPHPLAAVTRWLLSRPLAAVTRWLLSPSCP